MAEPVVAQKAPYAIDVTAGQKYFWCACGLSKNQPFCDGAHKAVGLAPLAWTATETKKAFFCGCKATHNKPMCDGTHKALA